MLILLGRIGIHCEGACLIAVAEFRAYAPWFCGSSIPLTAVPFGTAITQLCPLARAFSHSPALILMGNDGCVRHNGRMPGYLYQVVDPVIRAYVTPAPGPLLPEGAAWWTRRPFQLSLLERTAVAPADLLSPDEEVALRLHNAQRQRGC